MAAIADGQDQERASEDGAAAMQMLDLVVVGAGPHAASLLCRLIDDEPDLLTERERVHVVQKAGKRGRSWATVKKHLKKTFNGAARLKKGVAVVDLHGRVHQLCGDARPLIADAHSVCPRQTLQTTT